MKKAAIVAAVATLVALSATPAQAKPAPETTTVSGVPVLVKPADVSWQQWTAVNPQYGMSLAQQAQAYKNGLFVQRVITNLENSTGNTTAIVVGVRYSKANVDQLKAFKQAGAHHQITGLPQWYDTNPANDGYIPVDENWLEEGTDYQKEELGYNPNFFDSKEEQTAFLASVIVNRQPFPEHNKLFFHTDWEVVQAGLYMYQNGKTPAPNTGKWAESWDRVKPEGFTPTPGTGPLEPVN